MLPMQTKRIAVLAICGAGFSGFEGSKIPLFSDVLHCFKSKGYGIVFPGKKEAGMSDIVERLRQQLENRCTRGDIEASAIAEIECLRELLKAAEEDMERKREHIKFYRAENATQLDTIKRLLENEKWLLEDIAALRVENECLGASCKACGEQLHAIREDIKNHAEE